MTQFEVLKAGVNSVWNQIGGDAIEACGGKIGNKQAIEFCVDADRLQTFNEKEAYDVFKAIVAECGYIKVLNSLNRQLRLV